MACRLASNAQLTRMGPVAGWMNRVGVGMKTKKTKKSRRGFTLVEVLVATVLVAIAVTGVMGGIGALTSAQAKARDADLLQKLAAEKINDLSTLTDPTTIGSSGDFSDRNYPDVTWTADIESTNITNVDEVTITASRGKVSQSLMTMVYVPPQTGTTTTATGIGAAAP